MTRDECLRAVSAAFKDVYTWAVVSSWHIKVETKPPRELVLSQRFVETAVLGCGMTPAMLTQHIVDLPESEWATNADGSKLIVLR
jgi:hypothetical protein